MKKVGIVRFLGTNCDRDAWQAVEKIGLTPEWLWYEDQFNASDYQAVILPGGFSYGDYIRSGALAAKSEVMKSVIEAAGRGTPVLGICNGFQVLCDAGLLPGALLKNESTRFIDKWVDLELENACPSWGGKNTHACHIPIAHGEGRFYDTEDGLKKLQDNQQVWLKYKDNPNGSLNDIAGVLNETKNVAGLMPHPERALWDWMGSDSGNVFFETLLG